MAYCPHCTRDGMAPAHIDRCPDNPPVHAAIGAALTDSRDSRYAIGSSRYGMIAVARGVPAESTLIVHYGSWDAVVRAFGLLPASARPRTARPRVRRTKSETTAPCRHCGVHYLAGPYLDNHEGICAMRPEILQAVRAIAERADNPGVGVGGFAYDRLRVAYNETKPDDAPWLPNPRAFTIHFRDWAAFLHHLGLMTEDEAIEAKIAADNARYRAAWREHHEHELDSWGLPVASKQKPMPIVRVLPDGRKATMIR